MGGAIESASSIVHEGGISCQLAALLGAAW